MLSVVGKRGKNVVAGSILLLDLKKIKAGACRGCRIRSVIGSVNVHRFPSDRIGRLDHLARHVVLELDQLRCPIIKDACDLDRLGCVFQVGRIGLIRVLIPNPVLEGLFRALDDSGRNVPINIVKPMRDLRFRVVSTIKRQCTLIPIEGIAALKARILRQDSGWNSRQRLAAADARRTLPEFHTLGAAQGICRLNPTGAPVLPILKGLFSRRASSSYG